MDKNKKTEQQQSQSFQKSVLYFIDSYLQEIIKCIVLIDKQAIEHMIEIIMEAYRTDKKIYILGNGGGASTASHMACDLGKGTLARVYDPKEKRLHVFSLTDNVALITAYANDIGYDDIFLQQLKDLLEQDDVVIAISGSGNTKNVLTTVSYAKKIGAKTIGLTGFKTGGKLAQIVDLPIVVDTSHYGPVEDIHMIIGHLVAAAVASAKHEELPNGKVRKNKAVPFYIEKF